jgi:dynein heavy chain
VRVRVTLIYRYPISYKESLNTVLLQEAMRYNVLLIEMSSSLKDLLNALKGLVVMSDKLEAMASCMYSNKVPENWENKAFASLKPLGKKEKLLTTDTETPTFVPFQYHPRA